MIHMAFFLQYSLNIIDGIHGTCITCVKQNLEDCISDKYPYLYQVAFVSMVEPIINIINIQLRDWSLVNCQHGWCYQIHLSANAMKSDTEILRMHIKMPRSIYTNMR